MAVRILPFPSPAATSANSEEIQRKYSAAIDSGDLLTVFYGNLQFHGHSTSYWQYCLIETTSSSGKRSMASDPTPMPTLMHSIGAPRHVGMIAALRTSNRNELIALTPAILSLAGGLYTRVSASLGGVKLTRASPR